MKKQDTETRVVLNNVDRDKEAVIAFDDIKNTIKKYTLCTEIIASFESILNTSLHAFWDEKGGCLLELNDDQLITIILNYSDQIEAMEINGKSEITKTLEFLIVYAISQII